MQHKFIAIFSFIMLSNGCHATSPANNKLFMRIVALSLTKSDRILALLPKKVQASDQWHVEYPQSQTKGGSYDIFPQIPPFLIS